MADVIVDDVKESAGAKTINVKHFLSQESHLIFRCSREF
jgi:hypothetical protein